MRLRDIQTRPACRERVGRVIGQNYFYLGGTEVDSKESHCTSSLFGMSGRRMLNIDDTPARGYVFTEHDLEQPVRAARTRFSRGKACLVRRPETADARSTR
jgi:hypothetical protein